MVIVVLPDESQFTLPRDVDIHRSDTLEIAGGLYVVVDRRVVVADGEIAIYVHTSQMLGEPCAIGLSAAYERAAAEVSSRAALLEAAGYADAWVDNVGGIGWYFRAITPTGHRQLRLLQATDGPTARLLAAEAVGDLDVDMIDIR